MQFIIPVTKELYEDQMDRKKVMTKIETLMKQSLH